MGTADKLPWVGDSRDGPPLHVISIIRLALHKTSSGFFFNGNDLMGRFCSATLQSLKRSLQSQQPLPPPPIF